MLVQNIAYRKSDACGSQIVLQPHVFLESSVSQLRYGPRLQHWWISFRIRQSIEKLRSNQIICCHTRPYHHMQSIMFHLLREIWILLWQKTPHFCRVLCDNGTFATEKYLWAGYGIWECVTSNATALGSFGLSTFSRVLCQCATTPSTPIAAYSLVHCRRTVWYIAAVMFGNSSSFATTAPLVTDLTQLELPPNILVHRRRQDC